MKNIRLLLVLSSMALTGCASSNLIDFDDLSTTTSPVVAVGQSFKVGDVVTHTETGIKIMVLPFYWANNQPAPDGFVEVVQDGKSGGTGNEIHFDNASLGVISPASKTINKLRLKFGEYGGNVNLRVNEDLYNYQDFDKIPPQLGPVKLSVTFTSYPQGILTLTGPMEEFPIDGYPNVKFLAVVGGGQELWIDDLEFWE